MLHAREETGDLLWILLHDLVGNAPQTLYAKIARQRGEEIDLIVQHPAGAERLSNVLKHKALEVCVHIAEGKVLLDANKLVFEPHG